MLMYVNAYRERKLKKMNMTEEQAEAEEIEIAPPSKKKFCCIPQPYPAKAHLEYAIDKISTKIEEERKHFDVKSEKDLFVGTAFVTINNQKNVEEAIEKFKIS